MSRNIAKIFTVRQPRIAERVSIITLLVLLYSALFVLTAASVFKTSERGVIWTLVLAWVIGAYITMLLVRFLKRRMADPRP
jgi:hypothetical protein